MWPINLMLQWLKNHKHPVLVNFIHFKDTRVHLLCNLMILFYYLCAADLTPKFNSAWWPTRSTVIIAIQNAICTLQWSSPSTPIIVDVIFSLGLLLLFTSGLVFSLPAGPFSMIKNSRSLIRWIKQWLGDGPRVVFSTLVVLDSCPLLTLGHNKGIPLDYHQAFWYLELTIPVIDVGVKVAFIILCMPPMWSVGSSTL